MLISRTYIPPQDKSKQYTKRKSLGNAVGTYIKYERWTFGTRIYQNSLTIVSVGGGVCFTIMIEMTSTYLWCMSTHRCYRHHHCHRHRHRHISTSAQRSTHSGPSGERAWHFHLLSLHHRHAHYTCALHA